MGNVPSSLLQFGSVSEVEDYCKKLIDVCGKGGGYVMTHMPIDEAKPENIRAMIDATRKYGKY
jgi:uroporphyrinogen-III decarboxylase